MNFELIRVFILGIGWPLLLIGGIVLFMSSYRFYINTKKLALGKLIVSGTVAQLVGMLSLGVVATTLFYVDVRVGVFFVTPVFAVWFIVMTTMYFISRKWSGEAEKINVLFYKLKERSDELEREKGKLVHVADNMRTGSVLLDNEGKILFVNRETRNILGFDTESDGEVLGALYQKFSKYDLKKMVRDCIEGKPSNIFEAETDGKIYEIFLRSLFDDNDKSLAFGHFVWIQDITEEKALERSRSKFVSVASHKLRTPLSGIKMNVEMLSDECQKNDNQDVKLYINNIMEASANMSALVDQLLHVAAADASDFKVDKELVSLPKVFESVIEKYKVMAGDNLCQVNFSVTEGESFELMSDKDLLTEVFEALIDNAIRYSNKEEENRVNISLSKKDGSIEILISDTGVGIPKNVQDQVFSKFFRSDNALMLFPNGVGVNLSMAKDIIKTLDGNITFDSTEGVGTTFKITLKS